MLNESKIKEIREDYKKCGSIYATAKKYKVNYLTVRKYVSDTIQVDKRQLLPALKSQPASKTSGEEVPQEEENINNNINNIDINKYKEYKYIDKGYKDNIIPSSTYTSKTISSLQQVISKLLKRLNKEYKDLKVSQLPVAVGILLDKYKQLSDTTLSPTNQVILNFYGDKIKVKELLEEIQESKTNKEIR